MTPLLQNRKLSVKRLQNVPQLTSKKEATRPGWGQMTRGHALPQAAMWVQERHR